MRSECLAVCHIYKTTVSSLLFLLFKKYIDKLDEVPVLTDKNADYVVQAAIKKGIGLDKIDEALTMRLCSF